MLDLDLLRDLVSAHSVSGCEARVADLIGRHCEPFADGITRDALGNLFVHKKGAGKKIMLSAHMDSIGLIVTYIEKEGFLRFSCLGGVRLNTLPGSRVLFPNGTPGVLALDGGVKPGNIKAGDFYIDLGVASKEEAERLVQVGDTAVFDSGLGRLGGCLVSRYMDDRIGCYVLIETLKRLGSTENDCWFVFSAQEEVGLRGAKTAAFAVDPDFAVAVDVTWAADTPKCEEKSDTAVGKGAVIKLMDVSVICHADIVALLKASAEAAGCPYQLNAAQLGGTDAGAIHVSRSGVPSGVLSVPTRYIHTPSEVVSEADVEGCVKILCAMLDKKYE